MLLLPLVFLKVGETKAQGIADSLLYRQAKLEIWCETIRFIYTDNGADSLLSQLQCQDWMALENSLEPNYLQTRNFYQAIEKPTIYKGYSTYNSKLQKLVEEIGKKLKSSPGRASSPGRLQGVDSLQASLLTIANSPTSALSINPSSASGGNGEVEKKINKVRTIAARQEAANETKDSETDQMDWTEILQWLLLVLLTAGLVLLWVQNRNLKKDLNLRMNRRKQEISAITRMKESDKPENVKPKTGSEPRVSQAEVARIVRAEIEKVRQQTKKLRQQAYEASQEAEKEKVQNYSSAPVVAQEEPNARAQQDNFVAPKEEEERGNTGLFYDKLPFKGGFHQNHLSTQRHPDSIYSIQVLDEKPDEAHFWVTEDQEVQKYAMQNGLSFFEEACEYSQVEENPSRVRNLEKGRLRKNGHLWEIEKKVKVSFE